MSCLLAVVAHHSAAGALIVPALVVGAVAPFAIWQALREIPEDER